jgi:hypothetical protein
VPVGFNLFYDTGSGQTPIVPKLGLTAVPNIESAGITVDSEGTVTFKDGSTVLGAATVSDGVATLLTTPPAAGPETITPGGKKLKP